MKTAISTLFIIIYLSSCSTNNGCSNRFDFISCNESIPILNLKISGNKDTVLNDICNLPDGDFYSNDWNYINSKMPFTIEGQEGFLNVKLKYSQMKCIMWDSRVKYKGGFTIFMHERNEPLLVNGDIVELDSLSSLANEYFELIGNDEFTPKSFKSAKFVLSRWQFTDSTYVNDILTILYKSHLAFVESKTRNFCSLKKHELSKLKEKYPLNIVFIYDMIKRGNSSEVQNYKLIKPKNLLNPE